MRGHTHAMRAATRHSRSRVGLATTRGWDPAVPEEAGLTGGGHDLARISVSAPAASAPIQRVRTADEIRRRYMTTLGFFGRRPPPQPQLQPPPQQQQQRPIASQAAAPTPSLQALAALSSASASSSSSSSSSSVNRVSPPSSPAIVPSLSQNGPPAPDPLAASVPARRLDDIDAASSQPPVARPPSPRNNARSEALLASLLDDGPASAAPRAAPSPRSSAARSSSVSDLRVPLLSAQSHPLAQAPSYGSIQAPVPAGPVPAAPAQAPGSSFGENVRDFVTANTPGPITGLSGATSTAVSLSAGPANNPTGGLGRVGLGTNLATGAADAVGILSDVYTMGSMGPSRFGRGLVGSQSDARNAQEAEDRSASKRVAANTVQNAWDATSQANSILTATGQHVPQAVGAIASGAGVGVNALVAARSAYRGIRAGRHEEAMNAEIARGGLSPAMQAAAQHHADQMNTRKKRSWLGFGGAALGVAGGAMLLAGLGPVGWAFAGLGGLVAAGLGAYKFGRWAYKKATGTLGVERDRHARTLHDAINDPTASHADRAQATRVLGARGITQAQVRGPEGRDLLKRKAEAW